MHLDNITARLLLLFTFACRISCMSFIQQVRDLPKIGSNKNEMLRRAATRLYVKPPQGYLSQLPRATRDTAWKQTFRATDGVLGATNDAVPRRSHVDFAAQEEAKIQAATSEVAAASASVTQNTWVATPSVQDAGVNAESYAKWICEKYNLTRDEYESAGLPNLLAMDKRRRFAVSGSEDGSTITEDDLPDLAAVKGRDVDEAVLEEQQLGQPEAVMKELFDKKIYAQFYAETLRGDGPAVEAPAVEANAQEDVVQSLDEAARLPQ